MLWLGGARPLKKNEQAVPPAPPAWLRRARSGDWLVLLLWGAAGLVLVVGGAGGAWWLRAGARAAERRKQASGTISQYHQRAWLLHHQHHAWCMLMIILAHNGAGSAKPVAARPRACWCARRAGRPWWLGVASYQHSSAYHTGAAPSSARIVSSVGCIVQDTATNSQCIRTECRFTS